MTVVGADRKTAPYGWRAKPRVLCCCRIDKSPAADVAIQFLLFRVCNARMIQRNILEDMAVDHQKIPPAVVVEIKKSRPKAAVQKIRLAEPRGNCGIEKSSVSVTAIEPIQLEIELAQR